MAHEVSLDSIVRRVRAEMAAQRRTQGELAEALGITVPMVRRRMAGEVAFSAVELARTARFLDVSVDSLLGQAHGDRLGVA